MSAVGVMVEFRNMCDLNRNGQRTQTGRRYFNSSGSALRRARKHRRDNLRAKGSLGQLYSQAVLGALLARVTTNGCSVILRVLLKNGHGGYEVVSRMC
jgi:hypothetical protein